MKFRKTKRGQLFDRSVEMYTYQYSRFLGIFTELNQENWLPEFISFLRKKVRMYAVWNGVSEANGMEIRHAFESLFLKKWKRSCDQLFRWAICNYLTLSRF